MPSRRRGRLTALVRPDPWQELERLHDRPVNFSATEPREEPDEWQFDAHLQPLTAEPPGPPHPGGSWEVARRILGDYAIADPRILRAVYRPETPLDGRDMLLVGRFFGLRFHLGARVCEVIDEEREVDGRPVRVWGWAYRTLEGHLEAGQMEYEVWKWTDTGAVEFRIRRCFRTATIRNPLVRLGWLMFGRWVQVMFVRRACARMTAFVRHELGLTDTPPPEQGSAERRRPYRGRS